MARPMRRKGSSFHQFRKRIPLDVLNKARGMTLALPVGNEVIHNTIGLNAIEVTASLRTRDPNEAKARQSALLAYLEGVWASLRNGPARLTHKQVLGLAGEAYRGLVGAFEDDPGEASLWSAAVKKNASVLAQGDTAIEKWFGPSVDQVLAAHQLHVNAESRKSVIDQVALAVTKASIRVAQFAGGDYSPDTVAGRYPSFTQTDRPAQKPPQHLNPAGQQSITGLVQGWWKEAKAAGRSISTYEAYERSARLLAEFLQHDVAHAVTDHDIIRFKDHRLDQGVSLKTITGADLPGIRQLFQWGIANKKLTHNPAKDIKVAKIKTKRVRDPGFTDEEAKAILSHSRQHLRTVREAPHLYNARRWVPWLCAYSGARVGEMAQVRKQDVRQEDGTWVIRITPEANTVKDAEYRDVPIHKHIIEMGFVEFVQSSKPGHLFMSPSSNSEEAVRGAWRTTKNRVTDFVREVNKDPNVQPNHAWRHRFMTVGRDVGISKDIRFAITGHDTTDEGDDYGVVSIKAKAAAIALLPRYET
ncbi:DUF6538 domain-containing protein [Brucellaceae bacterium D45D]